MNPPVGLRTEQLVAYRAGDEGDGALAAGQDADLGEETVQLAVEAPVHDRNTRLDQPRGVHPS